MWPRAMQYNMVGCGLETCVTWVNNTMLLTVTSILIQAVMLYKAQTTYNMIHNIHRDINTFLLSSPK
jgi:hypothetical protein